MVRKFLLWCVGFFVLSACSSHNGSPVIHEKAHLKERPLMPIAYEINLLPNNQPYLPIIHDESSDKSTNHLTIPTLATATQIPDCNVLSTSVFDDNISKRCNTDNKFNVTETEYAQPIKKSSLPSLNYGIGSSYSSSYSRSYSGYKPKTVYVRSYTRKDGTYVRSHYRSSSRRR